MKKNDKLFEYIMNRTVVLKYPKPNIATFGVTNIHYYLLTRQGAKKAVIREGKLISRRPRVITPQDISNVFEGFGEGTEVFAEELFKEMDGSPVMLEYRFEHVLDKVHVEKKGLKEIYEIIKADSADDSVTAIIKGQEEFWSLSLMKFIVEMTLQSYYKNISDLKSLERLKKRHEFWKQKEIEELFLEAEKDPRKSTELAERLKEWDLFEKYEDRFLSLFKKKNN